MQRIILPVALCGLALGALIHGPAPRLDAWRVIGPGGAGGMFLPTISPHDPHLVLEHCDMTGSYISQDAGRSWRMFNLRGTVSAFAFDPRDPKVIYTGSHALFRSQDTGKTWKMILPDPARTVEHMRDDHAAPMLTTDDPAYLPNQRISRIAIDPGDSKHLYVVWGGGNKNSKRARLCESKDSGAHWTTVKDFTAETIPLVYFDRGVHVITGQSGPSAAPILAATAGIGILYVTSADGLFVSHDTGKTWEQLKDALPGNPKFSAIACATLHPQTAYVAFTYPRMPGKPWAGIAKTTDGGAHWTKVYEPRRNRRPT